jgi:hypothetical protein
MTSEGSKRGASPVADEIDFSHGDGAPRNPGDRISSTTRYLSGAAYVDERYADLVIHELVADSHRAVAPSLGYDVTAVIRHCFRAQRLWLAQNAIITAILLLGLIAFTSATVTLLVVCVASALFTSGVPTRGKWPTWKIVVAAVAAFSLLSCLLWPFLALLDGIGSNPFGSSGLDSGPLGDGAFDGTEAAQDEAGGALLRFLGGLAVITLAAYGTVVWSRHRLITTITSDLARGGAGTPSRNAGREVEQRLRAIDDAQHGNILLHSGYEPFVGAGQRTNAWSIATELHLDEGAEEPEAGLRQASHEWAARNGSARGRTHRVEIDPVELVTYLRQRLAALRSKDLPPQERITGLQLRDQIVSSGTRWHDHPLVDDRARLPFSYAPPEAVNAIIRFPQTGARHFLRATVGAQDKAAVSDDGRTIMPAEHQNAVSSTYLHVAVEGGMLYVELVSSIVGPIRQQYLDIDTYDKDADVLASAAGQALRRFLPATAAAPIRLARSALRSVTLVNAMHRADREATHDPVYDFGARLDIRELASRNEFANYLQRLDAEKYTRLIDRRATEAIYEYLTDKGVDTSDFTAKVNFRQYNSTTIGGSSYGPVATGTGATATMAAAAAAAFTGGKKKES